MIVQVPRPTFVTNIPDTVQTLVVEDENETTNFEEAAAESPNPLPVKSEVFLVPGLGNSIVWSPAKTVNDTDTGVASKMVSSPAWLASIVQVPAVSSVTVLPLTEHTLDVCEAQVTVRPDDAVAPNVTGPAVSLMSLWPGKVMVCAVPVRMPKVVS